MANLKIISMRLKSVKNTQKIVSAMKMVSSAKFARAERELRKARPLGNGALAFYEKAEVVPAPEGGKELFVLMTSDRGLCGGCHSGVFKHMRNQLMERQADGKDISGVNVICVGDKSRGPVARMYKENLIMVGSEYGRLPPTFTDASKIANAVFGAGQFDKATIIYNHFNSLVSYKQTEIPLFTPEAVEKAGNIAVYDSLDSDVTQSYLEFSTASLFFYALKEGVTSEQSARMTAMGNSDKNAGEMIQKLQILYNRSRQAVITGELIEIISGAAAL